MRPEDRYKKRVDFFYKELTKCKQGIESNPLASIHFGKENEYSDQERLDIRAFIQAIEKFNIIDKDIQPFVLDNFISLVRFLKKRNNDDLLLKFNYILTFVSLRDPVMLFDEANICKAKYHTSEIPRHEIFYRKTIVHDLLKFLRFFSKDYSSIDENIVSLV